LVGAVHTLHWWFRTALVIAAFACVPALHAQRESSSVSSLASQIAAQDSADQDTAASDGKLPSKKHPLRNTPVRYTPLIVWREPAVEAAAFSLLAAFLLSLPIAAVYRYTTPVAEFDDSIAQSILVLPATVAGIILVVQNSLALAFSLAGVVTAVRFRSSLKDTNDATYIFLSVAIGLAAGARAFDIAVVVCAVVCMALLVIRMPRFPLVRPRVTVRPEVPAAAPEEEGASAEPTRVYTVLVHSGNIERMQPAVEKVLTELTKGFQLTASGPNTGGVQRLVYAARLKKKHDARELETALNDVAAENGGHADVTTGPASDEHTAEWEASAKNTGNADPDGPSGGSPR
jgi:hypothetical protein